MYPDDFELAFSQFLDGRDYDKGSEALFALARAAFLAGWRAGRQIVLLSPTETKEQN